MNKEVDIQKLKFNQVNRKTEKLSDAFVQEHLPMITKVARGFINARKVPSEIEISDLINWGIEGLVKAKKNFKENKNSQFATYAFYRIRGEIMDKIRQEWQQKNPSDYYNRYRKKLREKIEKFLENATETSQKGVSGFQEKEVLRLIEESAMVYMLSTDTIEMSSHSAGTRNLEIEKIDEDTSDIWEEIKKLDYAEQQFIEFFYVQNLKQIEISQKLNLSKSKISRLHTQILSKLKSRFQKKGIPYEKKN